MHTLRACTAGLLLTLLVPGAFEAPRDAGVLEDRMQPMVDPGDDFYRYVNGRWLDRTAIPPDRSNYGTFTIIHERTQEQLRDLIDCLPCIGDSEDPEVQEARKISALYRSYMDLATIEERGVTPIQPTLERILKVNDRAALPALFAELQQIGIDLPVGLSIFRDARMPSKYALYVSQAGLGMPERTYYLSDKARFAELRSAYRAHVADMLALAGLDQAERRAEAVWSLESALAETHWTRVRSRDRQATYNPSPLADLSEVAPGFDWAAFFDALGSIPPERVIIRQPEAFTATARILAERPLFQLQSWIAYHVLASYAPYLSSPLVAEHFDFHQSALSGIEQPKARWKRALGLVERGMGEALGKRYVAEHFPAAYRARVQRMVDYLTRAYRSRIQSLPWMGERTREEALEKLDQFSTKIGYPEHWRDYSALAIEEDDLLGNVMRIQRHEFDFHYGKLGQPVDEDEWFMTPQTVNAYYSPGGNEIVFPAAILQPPFFDPAADDAVNYGAIGAVIGHEIGHGFDDQGSRFDGEGRMRNWWTDADRERFEQRTAALVEQYNAFCPLPDHCVNGALSLGENIGDLGGLSIAYVALQMALEDAHQSPQREELHSGEIGIARPNPSRARIDGWSASQRFFIGWGQIWARKYREDELINRLNNGPHAPDRYRTNGVVRNIDAWYEAFDVTPEDALYLAPEARVSIW